MKAKAFDRSEWTREPAPSRGDAIRKTIAEKRRARIAKAISTPSAARQANTNAQDVNARLSRPFTDAIYVGRFQL